MIEPIVTNCALVVIVGVQGWILRSLIRIDRDVALLRMYLFGPYPPRIIRNPKHSSGTSLGDRSE